MGKAKILIYIAWAQSLAALLGSLFMSRILNFPPCELCWYQRIFMFPILFILTVGILRRDKNLGYYTLPLSITGLLISIYHNFVYYGVISENLTPCRIDVPCNKVQLELFGFITIPLLSLIAFAIITSCIAVALKTNKK